MSEDEEGDRPPFEVFDESTLKAVKFLRELAEQGRKQRRGNDVEETE